MIIRAGKNVRYTHDTGAAVASLRKARELGHLTHGELAAAVEAREPFAPSYHHHRDSGEILRTDGVARYSVLRDPGEWDTVTLHDIEALYRCLVEDHGFTCMVCATPTAFPERGRVHHQHVAFCICDRQLGSIPPLVCGPCASFLYGLFVDGDVHIVENSTPRRRIRTPFENLMDRVRRAPTNHSESRNRESFWLSDPHRSQPGRRLLPA